MVLLPSCLGKLDPVQRPTGSGQVQSLARCLLLVCRCPGFASAEEPEKGPEYKTATSYPQAPHYGGESCPGLDLVGIFGAKNLIVVEDEKPGKRQHPRNERTDQGADDDTSEHAQPLRPG